MIEKFRNKKIGVICGGFSAESEVSLRSGKNVLNALTRLGYSAIKVDPKTHSLKNCCDVAFIALHGKYGEDGAIQGYFETEKIPYTGSRILASAIGMDKVTTKSLLIQNNLPTARFCKLSSGEFPKSIPFSFPLVVKPVSEGSSVGVVILDSEKEWNEQVPELHKKYSPIFVEEYVSGQEITVSILERNGQVQALPILELRPKKRFYDYEAKYTHGMTDFILPAELSPSATKQCQDVARKVHQLVGCRGFSRIDMICDPKRGPFVLEINTIPGLTDLSDLPASAKEGGISFDDVIEIVLQSAA